MCRISWLRVTQAFIMILSQDGCDGNCGKMDGKSEVLAPGTISDTKSAPSGSKSFHFPTNFCRLFLLKSNKIYSEWEMSFASKIGWYHIHKLTLRKTKQANFFWGERNNFTYWSQQQRSLLSHFKTLLLVLRLREGSSLFLSSQPFSFFTAKNLLSETLWCLFPYAWAGRENENSFESSQTL